MTNLTINLPTNFMNCVYNFLPSSDLLRIPDSKLIRQKEKKSLGPRTLFWAHSVRILGLGLFAWGVAIIVAGITECGGDGSGGGGGGSRRCSLFVIH